MVKKHYEVVAAIIQKDNLIFCCRRNNKKECPLKWEFPGGKIESGETREQALIREIKEELDCKINIEDFLITIEHEYENFSLTMHCYLCNLVEDEIPHLVEHSDARWCNRNELYELDFAEADIKVLNKLKEIGM